MKTASALVLGTRGSQLALAQTALVAAALGRVNASLAITTSRITTKGDRNMAPIPLDSIGKAWFTAEIEAALESDAADVAVHSLKDVPPEPSDTLRTMAVLTRADPRDVLITRDGSTLARLPANSVIGTDSLRRATSLRRQRPDIEVRSVRGNVQTRLAKLQDGYDAIVLAAAGLERLGQTDLVSEWLEPDKFVPAMGQGVLAVQARRDRPELWHLLEQLQDPATTAAVAAEQAYSAIIGGGCKLPVGCYARFEGDSVRITGLLGDDSANHSVLGNVQGPKAEAIQLAESLAHRLQSELHA